MTRPVTILYLFHKNDNRQLQKKKKKQREKEKQRILWHLLTGVHKS